MRELVLEDDAMTGDRRKFRLIGHDAYVMQCSGSRRIDQGGGRRLTIILSPRICQRRQRSLPKLARSTVRTAAFGSESLKDRAAERAAAPAASGAEVEESPSVGAGGQRPLECGAKFGKVTVASRQTPLQNVDFGDDPPIESFKRQVG